MIESVGAEDLARRVDPVTRRFADAGFRLFLVGGVVRDLVLASSKGQSLPSPDIDLTTDARPADIKRLVSPVAEAVWAQGERFGTIGAQVDGVALEITTHRAESYDPESRKPVVTFGHDLAEDLSRRDFTVNAMAIELPGLIIQDPYGGRADLEQGLLRTPLSPEISFSDDPLRVLRAARFCSRFGLVPTDELLAAATTLANRLSIVSVERVADELERLLAVDDPAPGLRLLVDVGALGVAIPSLAGGEAERAIALAAAPGADVVARRAGLLWPVRSQARAELRRLRYSRADQTATATVIDGVEAVAAGSLDRPGVRRLVHTVGPDLIDSVVSVAAAVANTDPNSGLSAGHGVDNVERLKAEIESLDRAEGLGPYTPALTGQQIMGVLDIEAGPVIGKAQRMLLDHRLDNGPLEADEAEAVLRSWWAALDG